MSLQDPNLNFITGMHKSGTTLLFSMLNTSDEVLCIPEIPALMYAYAKKRNKKKFNETDIEDWRVLHSKMKYVREIAFNFDSLEKKLPYIDSYKKYILHSYLTVVHPGKTNDRIQHIVDKNPIYSFYTPTLHSLFPEAKFVAMIRNPLGYVNSAKKQKSAEFHAYAWRRYASELKKQIELFPDLILPVKYEELVTSPESTLMRICSHFEIPYDPEMLTFYNKTFNTTMSQDLNDPSDQKRAINKFTALSKPVNTASLESWREKLGKKEIENIVRICKEDAVGFGYNFDEFSLPEKHFLPSPKSRLLIFLYFEFAKRFYKLPVSIREMVRKIV